MRLADGRPKTPTKPDGRKIELFVARVPAISLNKAPDPLFLIAGGPGTSAVDLYTSSAPALRSRAPRSRHHPGRPARHRPFESPRLRVRQPEPVRPLRRGRRRAREHQVPRRALEEVRPAPVHHQHRGRAISTRCARRSAIERINLYGSSYGTRVAQHYARRYPQATRTLILDGVINPETVLGPAIAIDAERALERILKRCKADASCAKAFADPYRRLPRAARAARAQARCARPSARRPPAGPSSSTSPRGTCPRCCDSPATTTTRPRCCRCRCISPRTKSNFTPLANQFRVFARSLEEAFAYGMHNSVACSEDTPLIDAREARPRGARRHAHGRGAGATSCSRPARTGPRAWSTRICMRRSRAPRPRCCCPAPTIR